MLRETTESWPCLCACLSIGPQAEQWAAADLGWRIQEIVDPAPWRFFVHRFRPERNGEGVRAEAVIAYRNAWECPLGDFTVDGRLRQLGERVQLQPPGELPAALTIDGRCFALQVIRRGGEAVQVWKRIKGPSEE